MIVSTVIVLMVAAGVCLADADEAASQGLCASIFATAVSPPLLVPLARSGYALAPLTNASAVAELDPLAPPPEA